MSTADQMQRELEELEKRADEMAEAIEKQHALEDEAKAGLEELLDDADSTEIIDEGEERVNVQVLVNGQDVGNVEGNRVLGAVIQEFGARHGLRTVVAFSGDARLTPEQATQTLQDLGVSTLDVRTKDQRA